MLRAWLFIPAIVLLTSASSIRPHQTDEESLKTALDAVTRKQRSLDFSGRDYYNDLQNFKYRPNDGDNDETFSRLQNQDLEDNDEDLEFLPLENGQLENIGGGYQNYNDKRLERALLDYLESSSGQGETVPSSFRERERTGSHKRSLMSSDRGSALSSNVPDRDLAALLYKELQKSPTSYHSMSDLDNRDYPMSDTLQPYYDRYLAEQSKLNPNNKLYDTMSSDAMSWGEIFGKQQQQQEPARIRGNKKQLLLESTSSEDEENDEAGMNDGYGNRESDWMYMLPTERRNVNGRYPLGREYRAQLKRYPLTKRSPKPLYHEKEPSGVINDPKVAKDLGPLFGSKKPGAQHSKNNRTSDDKIEETKDHDHTVHDPIHDHDHTGHDHDHSGHDHSHDHNHSGHDHSHDHEQEKSTVASSQTGLETAPSSMLSSSLASLVNSPKAPGQKELSSNNRGNNGAVVSKLLSKRADHVELAKKSVDWSDYFGIDRRRKKAALLARPGTQDRDDEWMLQRYYKTMAENLKSPTGNDDQDDDDDDDDDDDADKENGEKRNKLDQMDTRLKNVKNLIVEDALKYGSEGNSQEVKDVVMARLAAAYSLEKMRRALNEFRSNIAAQRDLMRAAHANNNETHHYRDSNAENKKINDNEKRAGHGIYGDELHYQGRNYEGFDEGRSCPALDAIVERCPRLDGKLRAVQELCIMHQICLACDDEVGDCASMFTFRAEKICQDIAQDPRHCVHMVSYSARQPSQIAISSCHHADSCLRRSYRYRQRGIYYQNGWPSRVAALDPLQLAER